jgi:hypothetical protein
MTAAGPGTLTNAANTTLVGLANSAFKDWQIGFSIFWHGYTIGQGTFADTCLAGISTTDGANNFVAAITPIRNGSTFQFLYTANGALQFATATPQNSMNTCGGTWTVGTSAPVVAYLNGVVANSGPFGNSSNTAGVATSKVVISGISGFPTHYGNVITNAVYFWRDRILTAEEMRFLDRSPYDFLIPAEGEAPMMLVVLPTLRQKHFRFRTDAGAADATPTWGALEDTN